MYDIHPGRADIPFQTLSDIGMEVFLSACRIQVDLSHDILEGSGQVLGTC
ncbi:MAG TPA: hypothetical protein VIK78_12445 [Ruminiclostridium sp.]